MELDGPMSHILSPIHAGSRIPKGVRFYMTAHSICVVKCGIGQSGPKSTWSYLGPIFSWLPYKERMVPHRLVGFPQFLLLS